MADNEVRMMMSVVPGTMSGFAAMNAGLVSINNVFSSMYRAFDQNFNLIDTILTTTSVVVTQLGIDAMESFGQMEQGMKIVQMVSGQTAQDMQYLKQQATEFSVQYRTDIDQITEGLQTLGRAGLNSATEQTEVLEAGLTTAKLEGRELNSVLQELIQNTALLGGDLKSDQFGETSEYLNDRLVATSMTAPITTHEISETLKYSGGIAAAAGANLDSQEGKDILDDYLAAIAAFAQKGVTGSIAGTALRAFFNKPATQDSSVVDALASIHLKPEYLWEDDEQTMKPISEQIGLIQNQMKELNVSTMDQLQIWSKIVGGKMGQQMMKLDSGSIKEIKKDIEGANDATDLAANSMKTYQANVKAIGESGAALQRDVGGVLVSIANPYLEFINKITGFLNNPITAWPLAGSILAFVGYLGKKIFSLISLVKSEIGTLISAMNQGINYHLGQYGMQYADGKIKPASGSSESSSKSMSINDFAKQLYGKSGGATLDQLRAKGMSNEAIGAWSRLGGLKKDSIGIGVSDGQIAKILLEENVLTKEQLKSLHTTLLNTSGSRSPFDSHFLSKKDGVTWFHPEIAAALEKNKIALERLGLTAEKNTGVANKKIEVDNAAVAAAEAHATALEPVIVIEEEAGKDAQKSAEQVTRATTEVVETISFGAETVVAEFNEMMAAISASVSQYGPKARFPAQPYVDPNQFALGKYINPSDPKLLAGIKESNRMDEDRNLLRKELGLPAKDIPVNPFAKGGMFYDETRGVYVANLSSLGSDLKNLPKSFGMGIDPKYISSFLYDKNGIAGPHVTHYADPYGVGPHPLGGYNMPYAGYQGRLPSQDAIDASLKANKEAEIKATQESAASKREEIAKIDQEIVAIQNDIDELEWFAAELAKAAEALAVLFPPGTGKGVKPASGIWAPGLTPEQKKQRDSVGPQKDNLKESGYSVGMRTSSSDQVITKKDFDNYNEPIRNLVLPNNHRNPFENNIPRQKNDFLEKGSTERANQLYGASIYRGSKADINDWNELKARGMQSNRSRVQILKDAYKNSWISSPGTAIANSAFAQTLSARWNADRSNRLLNFGSGAIGGKINGALNLLDAVGGPWMAAMIAIPAIVNFVKGIYEGYQQSIKEATENVKEAFSKRDEAESAIKNNIKESNSDLTEDELKDKTLESYVTLYDDLTKNHKAYIEKASKAAATPDGYEYDEDKDDGSMKIKEEEIDSETKTQEELQKNTSALYNATAEINNALTVLTTKMSDKNWGIDGWTGKISDSLGAYQDQFWSGEGTSFNSQGGKFLLTAQQQDENYSGYTEMSGLMLEDFKDAGDNWIKGMRTMMGDNVDFYSTILGTHTAGDDFMRKSAHFASTELSPDQNMRLQTSMKYDSKTWKDLGKELAKYENKNKTSYSVDKKVGRIQGLINKLQSTLGSGFDSTKVLQAAYLQIAQDMYSVAQTIFVPLIQQNATSAAQSVAVQGQTYQQVGGTGTNTYNTAAIASSIAAMLGTLALAQAGDAARTQALIGGDIDGDKEVTDVDRKLQDLAVNTSSGDEFMREAIKQSQGNSFIKNIGGTLKNIPISGISALGEGLEGASPYLGADRTVADYLAKIYGMTTYMSVYGMDSKAAEKRMDGVLKKAQEEGVSPLSVLQTLGKNWQYKGFVDQIEDAYLASGNEDEGSGSGSGSGSGNKDKDNTGTRKERVDLVLCNRKQIPKLNVNLFKKPPSFTILNKNFKLRDVKINSEDKPKAIMAAIKNSFIDIQKRTDPKIVQDENSVYDPLEATEGKDLPSGSSKTNTS